jgi:phage host-nuclease inhibitor protein Gam
LAKRAPAPAKPAIQSEEECAIEAQEFVELDAQVKRIEAEKKAAHEKIDQEYGERLGPVVAQRDEKFARVQAWGEANRRDRKTIKLLNERKLEWRRASNPSLLWVPEKFMTIVRVLLRLDNWEKYVSIEFRKNNIKADLPELQKKSRSLRRYLGLDKTVYFRIR